MSEVWLLYVTYDDAVLYDGMEILYGIYFSRHNAEQDLDKLQEKMGNQLINFRLKCEKIKDATKNTQS